MARSRAIASVLLAALMVSAGQVTADREPGCYSVYRLQQALDLELRMGKDRQRQQVEVDWAIHVRELQPGSAVDRQAFPLARAAAPGHRLHAFWVQDLKAASDGRLMPDPFLVRSTADSGGFVELALNGDAPAQRDIALAVFDLFQLTPRSGEVMYRNANGRYRSRIAELGEQGFERVNLGYLPEDGKLPTQVDDSRLQWQPDAGDACFYRRAEGNERQIRRLAENVWVRTRAAIRVELEPRLALAAGHRFRRLGQGAALWPASSTRKLLSSAAAKQALDELLASLPGLLDDRPGFLERLRASEALWPLLAQRLQEGDIGDALSRRLFWALSRIDSPASVEALTRLATAELSDRDRRRATLALYTTRAPLSPAGLERLGGHLDMLMGQSERSQLDYTWMRMLGGLARSRQADYPGQAAYLQQRIYERARQPDPATRAAMVDAIGNLGDAIDAEGEQLLVEALTADTAAPRLSAVEAYGRLPYKAAYGERLLSVLESPTGTPALRRAAVASLGQAPATEARVRGQLLGMATTSASPMLRAASLGSLGRMGIDWRQDELERLSQGLARETHPRNQRLMATIILRARRAGKP